jgi:hypothetical protein
MKTILGRVVGGKIEAGDEFDEGTPVAIVAFEQGGVELTEEEEAELADSLAAVRRGEFIDGYQLLRELRDSNRRSFTALTFRRAVTEDLSSSVRASSALSVGDESLP